MKEVNDTSTPSQGEWKWYERLALVSASVLVITLIIPYKGEFYVRLFNGLFARGTPFEPLVSYLPWFANNQAGRDFVPLLVVVAVSVLFGILIYLWFNSRINYTWVYALFRIVVRYKLVAVMFWYGIQKAFPIQMPFPTLSQLNTKIGDVTPAKLYWLTTGASPSYQIFCGWIELFACFLLLWRQTVSLGALLMTVIMVQVFALNIFYDAGVQMKSFIILILGLFLLAKDRLVLFNFFVRNDSTQLKVKFDSLPLKRRSKTIAIILKCSFILVFLVWRGYVTADNYFQGKTYKLPTDDGIADISGYYEVTEFAQNGLVLDYSISDSTRWRDVVFEEWNTISIHVLRSIHLNTDNRYRTTEFFSNAGREFYRYEADTLQKKLILERMGNTDQKIHLSYHIIDTSRIALEGIVDGKDTIRVKLEKIPRKYPLIDRKGIFVPY